MISVLCPCHCILTTFPLWGSLPLIFFSILLQISSNLTIILCDAIEKKKKMHAENLPQEQSGSDN
jgi:hypothetical protein